MQNKETYSHSDFHFPYKFASFCLLIYGRLCILFCNIVNKVHCGAVCLFINLLIFIHKSVYFRTGTIKIESNIIAYRPQNLETNWGNRNINLHIFPLKIFLDVLRTRKGKREMSSEYCIFKNIRSYSNETIVNLLKSFNN